MGVFPESNFNKVMSKKNQSDVKDTKANIKEIAFFASIISGSFMHQNIKLGEEGIVQHYDIVALIAEKALEKYPADFDWDQHYANNGDCIDLEIENFADQYIKNNDLFINTEYWRDANGKSLNSTSVYVLLDIEELVDGSESTNNILIKVDSTKSLDEQLTAHVRNYWNDEDVFEEDEWFVSWGNKKHKLSKHQIVESSDVPILKKYIG
eukprot:TRINITY_DN8214_c0_g2_i1.p1 TRINITY_DN8214_c0_g2~~TRINITY_DN8214_c0_g2_i1.p1  ORF type:complete len:209 (+),score=28.05 TRINITY_DN8214_c0_g2_i1:74-700(+)